MKSVKRHRRGPDNSLPADTITALMTLIAAFRRLDTAIRKLDAETVRRARENAPG